MTNIDIFLRGLSKAINNTDNHIIFVPRYASTKDIKFPAYTKFTLEVNEINKGVVTQKFTVTQTINTTEDTCCTKDSIKEMIKSELEESIITNMLKYYMYGESTK